MRFSLRIQKAVYCPHLRPVKSAMGIAMRTGKLLHPRHRPTARVRRARSGGSNACAGGPARTQKRRRRRANARARACICGTGLLLAHRNVWSCALRAFKVKRASAPLLRTCIRTLRNRGNARNASVSAMNASESRTDSSWPGVLTAVGVISARNSLIVLLRSATKCSKIALGKCVLPRNPDRRRSC